MQTNRRDFLNFIGQGSLALATVSLLPSCVSGSKVQTGSTSWKPLNPSSADKLLLADGLNYYILAKWGDRIGNMHFGTNNDFTSYIPFDSQNPNEGFLHVNHESTNPLFIHGWSPLQLVPKTKEQIDKEAAAVGTSLLHIKKNKNQWEVVKNSPHNMRLDGHTPIELVTEHDIAGSRLAYGTMANCAGGKTPWNTFLTCEENYDQYYGDWAYRPNGKYWQIYAPSDQGWHNHYKRSPLHYGWVVEINPVSKKARKLTALGRFAHEGATCVTARDGRTVVYMGDDANNQCIYKFISAVKGSLEKGTLYVANTEKGQWIPLGLNSHSELKKKFKTQTELLIRTREAARIVGGTPQDRPEDVEINPANNDVIVTLTNNKEAGRPHGSLLRIAEKNGDFLSLSFKAETWISGGEDSVLSCPDNLIFDKAGNLWVTSDRADAELGKGYYKKHKNNGLYYIPMKGENAGQIYQVASAPVDAEFTGPTFLPDGSLMLSVQHPGDGTTDLRACTSNWPDGPGNVPRSSVVVIAGELLEKLTT